MELKPLYKKSNTGAIQTWKIWVQGSTIYTEFGQLGGKLQTTEDLIKTGKNVGKANETTPEQQAQSEAESKWEKQRTKKGYVEELERAQADQNDLQGEECMLAHAYGTLENGVFVADQNKKIKFPCFVQPKFDGHRCRVRADKTLWSRGHKPIEQVPHIVEELSKIFEGEAPRLDGELYNHELKEDFEKLTSILKQKKQVHPEHRLAQYHVYDLDEPELNFQERHELLSQMLAGNEFIKLVETRLVNNHEEVLAAYNEFVELGYEGLMVRNIEGEYEGKRSYNLQKLKGFVEKEFKILGVNEGRGKLAGAAIFVCANDLNGETFDVKMEGSVERLKEFYTNESLWKGKELTVRFQGRTRKKVVPRFPVGLRIREDI